LTRQTYGTRECWSLASGNIQPLRFAVL